MNRQPADTRGDYRHWLQIPTRWMDNDVYGHVNNVVYYSYFDTVVNRYLLSEGVLDIQAGETIGLVVETHCQFFSPLSFPETVHAGLRVAKIGTSSARYEIGLFSDHADRAAAQGYFVHVYVDRQSRRPAPIPAPMRAALERISATP